MARRFRRRTGGLRSLAAALSRHQPSSRRCGSRNRIFDVGRSRGFAGYPVGFQLDPIALLFTRLVWDRNGSASASEFESAGFRSGRGIEAIIPFPPFCSDERGNEFGERGAIAHGKIRDFVPFGRARNGCFSANSGGIRSRAVDAQRSFGKRCRYKAATLYQDASDPCGCLIGASYATGRSAEELAGGSRVRG